MGHVSSPSLSTLPQRRSFDSSVKIFPNFSQVGVASASFIEKARGGGARLPHVGSTTEYFRSVSFNAYYHTSLSTTEFNI